MFLKEKTYVFFYLDSQKRLSKALHSKAKRKKNTKASVY